MKSSELNFIPIGNLHTQSIWAMKAYYVGIWLGEGFLFFRNLPNPSQKRAFLDEAFVYQRYLQKFKR